jgi:hypothetical protein
MSGLARVLAYTSAFILPPAIAGFLGFSTLRTRDHLAAPPALDPATIAAIPRPDIDPRKPTVVVVLGTDLTEITDALGAYQMFARIGRYNVVTAAAERQPTVLTGGLRILPHYSLREVTECVGGPPAIVDIPKLEKRYPAVRWVRGVRWVEHGQFVMSAGITSGIDASLRVIIRVAGDSVARRVARELRYANYHFAIDPTVEQYYLRPADLVLLANAAFRVTRPLTRRARRSNRARIRSFSPRSSPGDVAA